MRRLWCRVFGCLAAHPSKSQATAEYIAERRAFYLSMGWRPLRVHALDTPCRYAGTRWRSSGDVELIDCLVCLWHMGLYVPLVKLKEHQAYWRGIAPHVRAVVRYTYQ